MMRAKTDEPLLYPLPPDLRWLIAMEPTRANLDAYLSPSHLGPPGLPVGVHTGRFPISNVFASPLGTSWDERTYDLCGLAVDAYSQFFADPSHSLTGDPDQDDLILEDFEKVEDAWQKSNLYTGLGVNDVRRSLYHQWDAAIKCYNGTSSSADLYLNPHVSLPDPKLLTVLRDGYATDHLILLTTRHELGHLFMKVKAWHARACAAKDAPPGPILNTRDRSLIDARRRAAVILINRVCFI